MRLVVGLGNPGEKYKNNRHNVGYVVIDALASKIRNPKSEIRNKSKILIFKSKNYMNDSGNFVKSLTDHYSLNTDHLFIVHDDLDIPLGQFKIQLGKGPKDHNGIKSIDEALGTKQYWRVRVGIENRNKADGSEEPLARRGEPHFAEASRGRDYVLQDFSKDETKVRDGVINEICKKLVTF